jgi:hypothetical protein
MATTLFNYLYRDASNYKAWGRIALDGEVAREQWEAALAKLDGGEFFVAEQLGVPPLYQALYKWSAGPTSADHCWHTFLDIEVVDNADSSAYRWGDAEAFVARLRAVTEWRGELSPHFWLGILQ